MGLISLSGRPMIVVPRQVPPRPPVVAAAGGGGAFGNLFNASFADGLFDGLSLTNPGFCSIVADADSPSGKAFQWDVPTNTGDSGARGDAVLVGGPFPDLWAVFGLKIITQPNVGGVKTQKMCILRNEGSVPNLTCELNQIDDDMIVSLLFTESGNRVIALMGSIAAKVGTRNLVKIRHQALGVGLGTRITVGYNGVNNVFQYTSPNDCACIPDQVSFGGTLNANSGASKSRYDSISIGTVDTGWPL
ncbi:MAG TPA: hypothetical protein VK681_39300 [Reyranella sp.]|nr:hypothetical protein [Reyranella sp.]